MFLKNVKIKLKFFVLLAKQGPHCRFFGIDKPGFVTFLIQRSRLGATHFFQCWEFSTYLWIQGRDLMMSPLPGSFDDVPLCVAASRPTLILQ
jgi:hypothetical protein